MTTGLRLIMTVDAVGGVWQYAMTLAAALARLDVSVVFVGLGPRPSAGQARAARRLGKLEWLDQPLDWMAPDKSALAGVGARIEALRLRHGADLLHLNLPSLAKAIEPGVPVVAVSHSCLASWWLTMRDAPLPRDWLWRKQRTRAGLARADIAVAPSAAHASLMRRCYGRQTRIAIVHNAFGGKTPAPAKEPFFLAAGRWWDESKNFKLLDSVAEQSPWPLRLAGSTVGPSGETAAPGRAEQLGQLSHTQTSRLMRRAGVVVSPSLYEPFGLVALEGARAGAALALADIPTYRELWDGAALFFDPLEPECLLATLRSLAGDAELRQAMQQRAMQASLRYEPASQAQAMLAIYREAYERMARCRGEAA
jgi:glycosyltransferase involved in cell wall biosynthesis